MDQQRCGSYDGIFNIQDASVLATTNIHRTLIVLDARDIESIYWILMQAVLDSTATRSSNIPN
jgi:hypothetical protein